MPQSKQASICITIDMEHFTRLQHQPTYLKQLSKIIFNKVGPHHICFGEDTLRFNCIEHSSFHSYCSTSVLFLRVLRLALVFHPYYVQNFSVLFS